MINLLVKLTKKPAIFMLAVLSIVFSNLSAVSPASAANWWSNTWVVPIQSDQTFNWINPVDTANAQSFNLAYKPRFDGGGSATSTDVEFQFFYSTFSTPYGACANGIAANSLVCGDITVDIHQPVGTTYGFSGQTLELGAADLPSLPWSSTLRAATLRITLTSEAASNFNDSVIEAHFPINSVNYPVGADRGKYYIGHYSWGSGSANYTESPRTLRSQWTGGELWFIVDRTATWSPISNLLLADSPATPSEAPVWSAGIGGWRYFRDAASTSDCTVDRSTGAMTYTTVGTCVVRAAGDPDMTSLAEATYAPVNVYHTFNITLTPPAPTATFTSGAGSGTAPTVPSGPVASVPDSTGLIAPAGTTFSGWSCTPEGGSASAVAPGDSLPVDVNTTCVAQWTGLAVTFTTGAGTGTAPNDASGVINSMPGQGSMTAPAGKFFDGWVCSPGGVKAEGDQLTPTAATNCVAKWTGYAVTFTTGAGTGSAPSSVAGVVASMPGVGSMIAPAGNAFNGWLCSPGGAKAAASTLTPTAATTCVAQWTGYAVTFTTGAGTGTAPADASGVINSMPGQGDMVAPAGKFFDGWLCTPGGAKAEGDSLTPSGSTTCVAQWTGYAVTFTTGSGSGAAPSSVTGVVNSMPGQGSMVAPTSQYFNGWSCTPGGSVVTGSTFTPTAASECVAQWTLTPPFSISFDKGLGSGAAPASVGGPQVIPGQGDMVAPAGKFFDGWLCTPGGSKAEGDEVTPTADMTCVAQWSPYVVSFTTGAGAGTAPADANGYIASMPGVGNMVAPAGSYFAGWACPIEQFVLAGESFTPESDLTCDAIWWGYTVTFGAGSGSGSAPSSVDGVIDVLPGQGDLIAPVGKHFNGWVCTPGGAKAAGASLTPTAATNCVAVWVSDVVPTHKVVFKANGGSGSMPNQIRSASGKLGLNKFTRAGQKFVGWNTKADGSGVSYADGSTFNFAADTTLYAQWWFKSKQLVTTFDGDQPTLKANMKTTIANWLKTLPKGAAVVCLGSTSGAKITAFDKKLAFNRANNVCQYAGKLRSDINFVIKLNPSSDTIVGARHVWMYYNYAI